MSSLAMQGASAWNPTLFHVFRFCSMLVLLQTFFLVLPIATIILLIVLRPLGVIAHVDLLIPFGLLLFPSEALIRFFGRILLNR